MVRPSLQRLETAFMRWRDKKEYRFEPVPEKLLKRAQSAVAIHGLKAVHQVTGLERRLLSGEEPQPRPRRGKGRDNKVTSLLVPAPVVAAPPCLEVELPGNVRLRVFGDLAASVALVRELCRTGEP